ncbi:MAG: DNA phosphorothioation system sulfurtransferase DndC [Thaumarchaeota archaeon]|nr:DNA phosphorothioation system sulfurtransferase DndC [Nitrososphaerota archaeon]
MAAKTAEQAGAAGGGGPAPAPAGAAGTTTTRSVFAARTIDDIYEEVRRAYLADGRPWILGYSGGKDSTCMVQIVWTALQGLPPGKLGKRVYVISSDTLVESPKIVERITDTLRMMEDAAEKSGLPVSTNLVRPVLEDTFWVCLLGRGYPAPSRVFRWCTDRLKIRNADRFIREKVSEYGEAVVVLGTRKDESGERRRTMENHEAPHGVATTAAAEEEGGATESLFMRHSHLPSAYVYAPLRDFVTKDVWNYLLQNPNPWGANNRDLLALYKDADSPDCPLVVDNTTPSCGNSRFGCWTCTVVEDDISMRHLVENGEAWLEPLLELRDELKETQKDPVRKREVREVRRRDGQFVLMKDDGAAEQEPDGGAAEEAEGAGKAFVPGPYTMDFRRRFLRKLLAAQRQVRETGPNPDIELISADEVHEIQRLWRVEYGDWRDTAYAIYREQTGEDISARRTADDAVFSGPEQDMLEEACEQSGAPALLVSKLLELECTHSGAGRHAGIHGKIDRVLSEEWRTDLTEVASELRDVRGLDDFERNMKNDAASGSS